MRDWFDSLEPRERVLVGVAFVFVLFAVYWFAVWQPLARAQADLEARVENWQISLAELRPLAASLPTGDGNRRARAGANQSLVVIVDDTLRSRDIYVSLQRSQPTTTNGIRVEFTDIAFDDLVLWLGELGARYGLHVQSASFSQSSSNNPGRINAAVTLERSAA